MTLQIAVICVVLTALVFAAWRVWATDNRPESGGQCQ